MAFKHVHNLLYVSKYLRTKQNRAMHSTVMLFHCAEETHEEPLPSEWYEKAILKLTKLSHLLKEVDLIDGTLVKIADHSTVIDDNLEHNMHTFKSLARTFLGSASMQQALKKDVQCIPPLCFSKPSEREPITVNSLTKICNFLNISAQQRKSVRFSICRQVTQHQIWTGALEEVLNRLKSEIDALNNHHPSKGTKMGQQIVSSCLNFLDTALSCDTDSTSWMRLAAAKVVDSPASHKWEDVLQMTIDLTKSLQNEKELLLHVTKLEVMKEGLFQIKDVLIDKNIGYKETRYQESLAQKKLSKTLGHSSQCLFTLLLYYLYGRVTDIEVELRGGVYGSGSEDKFCLYMGKILTSDEEKMVWSGVKQLDRALGLFKFIWQTAKMKGVLEVQGHLWCVGSEDRLLKYKGNMFFLHGISL
ncbi:uncharacterized protein LOC132286488 [Cornus florida]|uniref:uncharacterized protein LOC132286488 n=1 Tax=Cornus florida TaxID=4283 RepID=UPI0028A05893|nr:uncharacterized protein LOC132286488 [Cornus florida]